MKLLVKPRRFPVGVVRRQGVLDAFRWGGLVKGRALRLGRWLGAFVGTVGTHLVTMRNPLMFA